MNKKFVHGCKLFYCTTRKGQVCCADCAFNPQFGGTCKETCLNSPEFCNQQTDVILVEDRKERAT